jgi:hypothetical protein
MNEENGALQLGAAFFSNRFISALASQMIGHAQRV